MARKRELAEALHAVAIELEVTAVALLERRAGHDGEARGVQRHAAVDAARELGLDGRVRRRDQHARPRRRGGLAALKIVRETLMQRAPCRALPPCAGARRSWPRSFAISRTCSSHASPPATLRSVRGMSICVATRRRSSDASSTALASPPLASTIARVSAKASCMPQFMFMPPRVLVTCALSPGEEHATLAIARRDALADAVHVLHEDVRQPVDVRHHLAQAREDPIGDRAPARRRLPSARAG